VGIAHTEEYADSEKYIIKTRDWNAEGNLNPLIATINRLRRAWPALQRTETLRFEPVRGERTLFYRKALPRGRLDLLSEEPRAWRNPVWIAVNVAPTSSERAVLRPKLRAVGIDPARPYRFTDLVTGATRVRRGREMAVVLSPERPFVIFTLTQEKA
jgi:starch synthase (maltosyl-transferring)